MYKEGGSMVRKMVSLVLSLAMVFINVITPIRAFAQEAAAGATSSAPVWSAWVKAGGKYGWNDDAKRKLGTLDFFIPLVQSKDDIWFAYARGKDASGPEGEWSLGGGYRRLMNDNLILGCYGFFDTLRSVNQNNYYQGTFGFEALTRDLDFRVNGYMPSSKKSLMGTDYSNPAVVISGTSIYTTYLATYEQALPGFDAEVGARIPGIKPDIRVYAGYFYFDNSDVNEVAGPRVRTEWRINDLFGINGMRLTLDGEFTRDDVRASQYFAGASVRIPFGYSSTNAPKQDKNSIEARMVEPIIRDIDIITGDKIVTENQPAINPLTGEPYSGIWYAEEAGTGNGSLSNPTDIFTAVDSAGENGIIAALDSNDTINAEAIYLQDGQTLIGSTGLLQVLIPQTLQLLEVGIPGENRPVIEGTDGNDSILNLADDNTISDINIQGAGYDDGEDSIYGGGINGVTTLRNVNITGSDYHGIHLGGIGGDINLNNVIVDGSYDSNLYIDTVLGNVNIDPSEFTGSHERGMEIYNVEGDVTLTDVDSNENDGRNIIIGNVNGTVMLDTVTANESDHSLGIDIQYVRDNVTLTNVTANDNDDTNLYVSYVGGDVMVDPSEFSGSVGGVGADIINVIGDVTLSRVTANNNYYDNIYIDSVGYDGNVTYSGGNVLIEDTTANGSINTDYGIYIENVYSNRGGDGSKGDVTLNNVTANDNSNDGINLYGVDGDVQFTDVTATGNTNSTVGAWGAHLQYVGDVTIDGSDLGSNYRGLDIYDGGNVTITDSTFNANSDRNLQLLRVGDVVFNNVTANDNVSDYGIRIYNATSVAFTDVTADGNYGTNLAIEKVSGDVTIDPSSFSNSNSTGIEINNVLGDVQLTDVTANGNSNYGAFLGDYMAGIGNVTIVGSQFDSNYRGLAIRPAGDVTITDSTADDNSYSNIMIGSVNSLAISNTTANDSANAYGMYLRNVSNDVTLNNVTANDNYNSNLYTQYVGGDVVIDPSNFSISDNHGIEIYNVTGGVSISDTTAIQNYNSNIVIDGVYGTMGYTGAQPSVDLEGGSYAVQLHSVTANGSETGRGVAIDDVDDTEDILIDNNGSGTSRQSHFNNNQRTNININYNSPTIPDVTILDTEASGSHAIDGIRINRADDVNIDGVTANGNYGDGIKVDANDNVSINNVTTIGNGDDGIDIDPFYTEILGNTTSTDNGDYDITIISGDYNYPFPESVIYDTEYFGE
jgi:hypothetical protein